MRLLIFLLVLLSALPARATPCADAVEKVLLKLPNRPEGFAEHAARIAVAIDRATTGTKESSALLAVGFYESGFQPRIQLGDCRTYVVRGQRVYECDGKKLPDGRIVFLARGFWQLHAEATPDWKDLIGLEQETLDLNARAAFRVLLRGFKRCRTVQGAISYYATPSSCRWPGAVRRAAFAEAVERKLAACGG